MSVPIVLCSLQIIQRNHIKNCVIINPESLNTVFKVATAYPGIGKCVKKSRVRAFRDS